MLNDFFYKLTQYGIPQQAASRLMGKLTSCQTPVVKNYLIKKFVKRYGVNLQEAKRTLPTEYTDFNDFFTRQLKDNLRPLHSGTHSVISPVDGAVSQLGRIKSGHLIQAKGRTFTAHELLGGTTKDSKHFTEGHFATLYLSPKDYHRVHMPLDGTLQSMTYIPGRLFSVSPRSADLIPNVFARNERLACLFDTPAGPMAIVLVGAFFVASIATVWSGLMTPNTQKAISRQCYDEATHRIHLNRGEEMGHFQLGSTVILLFGPDSVQWAGDIRAASTIKMGQLLGTCST